MVPHVKKTGPMYGVFPLGTIVCVRLQYDPCQPRTSVRGSGFSNPREHFHLLLTPAAEIPLEKALQFIKGGFSYRAKREIHFAFEMWQASFVNHRIRDAEVYKHHHTYIWENPVKAGLSERPELFAWSSAAPGMELDAAPPGLKP